MKPLKKLKQAYQELCNCGHTGTFYNYLKNIGFDFTKLPDKEDHYSQ